MGDLSIFPLIWKRHIFVQTCSLTLDYSTSVLVTQRALLARAHRKYTISFTFYHSPVNFTFILILLAKTTCSLLNPCSLSGPLPEKGKKALQDFKVMCNIVRCQVLSIIHLCSLHLFNFVG
jgi:hypothetical protein